jgi:hypothetical protein
MKERTQQAQGAEKQEEEAREAIGERPKRV